MARTDERKFVHKQLFVILQKRILIAMKKQQINFFDYCRGKTKEKEWESIQKTDQARLDLARHTFKRRRLEEDWRLFVTGSQGSELKENRALWMQYGDEAQEIKRQNLIEVLDKEIRLIYELFFLKLKRGQTNRDKEKQTFASRCRGKAMLAILDLILTKMALETSRLREPVRYDFFQKFKGYLEAITKFNQPSIKTNQPSIKTNQPSIKTNQPGLLQSLQNKIWSPNSEIDSSGNDQETLTDSDEEFVGKTEKVFEHKSDIIDISSKSESDSFTKEITSFIRNLVEGLDKAQQGDKASPNFGYFDQVIKEFAEPLFPHEGNHKNRRIEITDIINARIKIIQHAIKKPFFIDKKAFETFLEERDNHKKIQHELKMERERLEGIYISEQKRMVDYKKTQEETTQRLGAFDFKMITAEKVSYMAPALLLMIGYGVFSYFKVMPGVLSLRASWNIWSVSTVTHLFIRTVFPRPAVLNPS